MARSSFVLTREEAISAGVTAPDCLPLLIGGTKPLARDPVSTFKVVAAGLGSSGRVFLGANVRFPGLPLHHSIHAEQFLVTSLTLNSEPKLSYLAISTNGSALGAPCGHCRQFLQEIREAPEIKILITDSNGENGSFVSLESLLPNRTGPNSVLPEDVPLLLEPRNNGLTLSNPGSDFPDRYPDLKFEGLVAANRSYAPYSKCPSGVALVDGEGMVYKGWYMESVACNPSLGPLQAALVDFVSRGGGQGFDEIVEAVLVEKNEAGVGQEDSARMILKNISRDCVFKVFHCCEPPKE